MKKEILLLGESLAAHALAVALFDAGFPLSYPRMKGLGLHQDEERRKTAPQVLALGAGAKNMLEALGVWQEMTGKAHPIRRMKVLEAGLVPRMGALHLDAAALRQESLGQESLAQESLAYAVFYEDLFCALEAALQKRAALSRPPTPPGAPASWMQDFSLVIAAASEAPALLPQSISYRKGSYRQHALTGFLSHDFRHHQGALQIFHKTGPLALLPLEEGISFFIWSLATPLAQSVARQAPEDYAALLKGHLPPEMQEGVVEVSWKEKERPRIHALSFYKARHLVGEKLCLIGDAALRPHPVAGQALNSALKDAAALVSVLQEARYLGENISQPSVLLRYQNLRRGEIAALASLTDAMAGRTPLPRLWRGLSLASADRIPFLKDYVLHVGAGLEKGAPPLFRAPPERGSL